MRVVGSEILIAAFAILVSPSPAHSEPAKVQSAHTKMSPSPSKVSLPERTVEPFDFKGIKLGSNLDKVKAALPFSLEPSDRECPEGVQILYPRDGWLEEHDFTVAGIKPFLLSFQFVQDASGAFQLSQVNVSFKSEEFSTLSTALETKYGKPSSVKTEVVQNKLGATFENLTERWHNPASSIELQRFSTSLEYSSLTYTHRKLYELWEQHVGQFLQKKNDKRAADL